MADWKDTFKGVGNSILTFLFAVGFVLAIVIVWQDIRCSYYGWGVVIEGLNTNLGKILSGSLSFLPTLVQMIYWAGKTAKSEIISHQQFRTLAYSMMVVDTLADTISMRVVDNLAAGDFGKAGMGLMVTVAAFGVLSEFIFMFCGAGLLTQIKTQGWFKGFEEKAPRPSFDLGDFVRGDSPIRPPISAQPPAEMPRPMGTPIHAPAPLSNNSHRPHRPNPGGPFNRGERP